MLSTSFIGHSKYHFCSYLLSPSTFPMQTLCFLPGFIIERSGWSNAFCNHCFCSSVRLLCGLPPLFTRILRWYFLAEVETTSFFCEDVLELCRTMFESRTSWLDWRAHCWVSVTTFIWFNNSFPWKRKVSFNSYFGLLTLSIASVNR